MTTALVLEAFGQLGHAGRLDAERVRERRGLESGPAVVATVGLLHRAFESRAEMMSWDDLWSVYEAGLVGSGADPAMVGWVYVGLPSVDGSETGSLRPQEPCTASWAAFSPPAGLADGGVTLSAVLPPLFQCLADALSRFGVLDVSAFRLACYDARWAASAYAARRLRLAGDWFELAEPVGADALVTFDRGLHSLVSGSAHERLRSWRGGALVFGDLLPVLERCRDIVPSGVPHLDVPFEPADSSLLLRLPEWSAAAAGWSLATLVDLVGHEAAALRNFVVCIRPMAGAGERVSGVTVQR